MGTTELRDSSGVVGDGDELRRRVVDDGYLFLPGLLDAGTVRRVRAEVLERLAAHGWLREGAPAEEARPSEQPRIHPHEGWWDGYRAILSLESFNRLAHDEALTSVMRRIVGDDLLVMPIKIARVTWPDTNYPTPPHQDFFFLRGTPDALTAWVPLGDCPRDLGGLRILPGSHHEGFRAVRAAPGAGSITVDVDDDDPRWTAPYDFRGGDVLVFHALTVHRAPENAGDRLRLSADYRYQSAADPLNPWALFPHEFTRGGAIPAWPELMKDWERTEWADPGQPVRLAPWVVDPHAVPESRFAHSAGATRP